METATDMLDRTCPQLRSLDVRQDDDPVKLLTRARRMVADIEQGCGVLVLTDMYGSTPSNIAHRLSHTASSDAYEDASSANSDSTGNVRVISGINLPMLVRALNYAHLSLEELAQKALSGGHEGILDARELEQRA